MKKLITTTLLVLFFGYVYAQKDVTTFLGIPVDGTRSEMINKLKEKGFTYDKQNDNLVGEFNGRQSVVNVKTHNNKVWRVTIADAVPSSESEIRIRFNNLCAQFDRKSDKYISAVDSGFYTPEDEDISYGITIKNKRYDAYYYQKPNTELFDLEKYNQRVREVLLTQFTPEQIENPTPEQAKIIEELTHNEASKITIEIVESKPVWFCINKYLNQYYIRYFYDNEYNNNSDDDL